MRRLFHRTSSTHLLCGGLVGTLLVLILGLFLVVTPSRAETLSAPTTDSTAPDLVRAPSVRASLASTATVPAWIMDLQTSPDLSTSDTDLSIAKSAITVDGTTGVVFNGELITYTLTVSNPGTAQATGILILDILPEESLSDIGCSNDCTKVIESRQIPDPFGNLMVITVTRQVSWTIDSLAPGQVQMRHFWGRVIGQTDGTELRNRAFMSYNQSGDQKSAVSNDTTTIVRVRIEENGRASLSDAPNWLSSDLGGTLSLDWGDMDGDGDLDLALGSTIGTSVYRNNEGRLTLLWNNNRLTYGVAWGDVNGDGTLELMAVGDSLDQTWVTSGTNYIYSLDGESVQESKFVSNEQLVRVAPGDYDGDGLLDLVVSTNSIHASCPVQLYKNSGDPTAPFDSSQCIGNEATAALGPVDWDSDGDLDLVMGAFPNQTILLVNDLLAMPNPFVPVTIDQTAPFLPYDFGWGDYNGDGHLDLAAAFPLERRVRIYRFVPSTGKLALGAEIPTSLFRTPLAIGWGDLNGDGRLDLAVADTPPRVYEYRNGRFSEIPGLRAEGVSGQVWGLGIGDVDNDGDLDLAFTNRDGSSMLFSNFAPLLSPSISPITATGSTEASSVAWADVDGDKDLDLLFGAGQSAVGAKRYLNVLGRFPPSDMTSLLASGFGPHSVAFGDVNRDGRLDIALGVGTVTEIQIYLAGNTVTPDWLSAAPHYPVHGLTWGDADDDGDLDLLVARDGPNALFVNGGTQLETSPLWTSRASYNSRSVAWGDFDGDGYLDFAVGNYGQPNEVYRNNRDNTFSLAWVSTYISNTRSVAWADYDGDGDPDLAVGNYGQPNLVYENQSGAFGSAEAWRSSASQNTTSLAWGDWNNDGDLDLAVGNDSQPDQVYANVGSQPGSPPQLYLLWASTESYRTTGVAWGDADGDGDLDLAVGSRSTGQNGIYKNTYATPSHLTGEFAKTMPLPNNPSYVSVDRPGVTKGAYFFSSADLLSGPRHPTVTLTYRLFDPDGARIYGAASNEPGDPILSTVFEFSVNGGATWNEATPMALQTAPTNTLRLGQEATFHWDAVADQAISDNAHFRICVVQDNQADSVQQAMACAASPPFRVRGTTCIWPQYPIISVSNPTPERGERVRFEGSVREGSGILTYTWSFGDGSTAQGQVVYHTYYSNNTYPVTLIVESEPCPISKEVVATRNLVVGIGQPNTYLPFITRAASQGTVSRQIETIDQETQGQAVAAEVQIETADAEGKIPLTPSEQSPPHPIQWLGEPIQWPGESEWAPAAQNPTRTIETHAVPEAAIESARIESSILASTPLRITEGTRDINSFPSLSGDGRRIAFWSTGDLTGSGSNLDGNIEVFVADIPAPDHITFRQVTDSMGNILGGFNLSPSLSGDGTHVTFFSDCNLNGQNTNPDANFEIFVAGASEWAPTQLTETAIGASTVPSINADATRIAFASDRDLASPSTNSDQNQEIFVYDAIQDRFIQISRTLDLIINNDPAISADGNRVAFISDGELVIATISPSDVSLTTVPSPTDGINREPAISADGRIVTWLSDDQVWLAELEPAGTYTTSPVTPETDAILDRPAISADGSRIAYVSNGGLFLFDKEADLISPIGSVSEARQPSLSADGTVVAFVADRDIYVTHSPRADLAVSKSVTPDPLVPGLNLTYTIVVANLGPSNAIGATVKDKIPLVIGSPQWTCTALPHSTCIISGTGSISDTVNIAAGEAITYTVTGDLASSATEDVTNTVMVTPSQDLIDWRPGNNQVTITNPVSPQADLRVTKAVDDPEPNEGDTISFTLVVTNAGPSDAQNTSLTDSLPAGLTFSSANPISGTYDSGLWTIGDLAAKSQTTLTLYATVDSGTGGQTLVNQADSLHSDADDPNLANNQASASLYVNLPPLANDDTASTLEDHAVVIDVLANDSDPDGTLDLSSLVTTMPSDEVLGVVTSTGLITYTPDADWHGVDSFDYEICDNDGACDTATVSVTVLSVNDSPSFDRGPDVIVNEDAPLQELGWATAISVGAPYEEQTLTFLVTNDYNALFTVQPSVDAPTGTLTFQPAPDLSGIAIVTATLQDDGGTAHGGIDTSAPVTFTITVTPVNDAPVAYGDSYTVTEDHTLNVPAPGVLANDTDMENDNLEAHLVTDVKHGDLSLNADGSFTYTPDTDYSGQDIFEYQARDDGFPPQSDTAMVTITITPINDPPVASSDTHTVTEDGVLTVAAPGVLANDTDVDDDDEALTAQLVTDVAHGTLNLSADGSFTYTPTADYFGPDSFEYQTLDDELAASVKALVTLTVEPVNDAPSFVAGPDITVDEDAGPQTVLGWATAISAGPPNEAGQSLTFLVSNDHNALFATQPAVSATSGDLTFESALDLHGQAVVTVTLKDDSGTAHGGIDTSAPQTFTLTVNPVNDPPVAHTDTYTVTEDHTLTMPAPGVLANDTDVDDDDEALTAQLVTDVAHGDLSLNPDGSFTYTPTADYFGLDSFEYQALDDEPAASVKALVTLTVDAVNDAPSLVAGLDITVDEDAGPQTISGWATAISAGPSNEAGQALTFLVSNNHNALFAAQPALSVSTGDLTFESTQDVSGTAFVTVTLQDDGGTARGGIDTSGPQTFTLTVNPVNDPPQAVGDTFTTYRGGTVTELDSGATSLMANDWDLEGNAFEVYTMTVSGPDHGMVAIQADGTFSYTHDGSATSSDGFVYAVYEPGSPGLSTTAAVSITITPFGVSIEGPTSGQRGHKYTFTTTVLGPATLPVTFTWEATEQTTVIQPTYSALTHTVKYQWTADGWKMITVTVSALEGVISDTHRIAIGTVTGFMVGEWQPRRVYLPLVLRPWPWLDMNQ